MYLATYLIKIVLCFSVFVVAVQVQSLDNETRSVHHHRRRVAVSGVNIVSADIVGFTSAAAAASRAFRRYRISYMRFRFNADVRCGFVVRQLLHTVHRNAGHILPAVLLRAKTRKKYKSGNATVD